MDWIVVWSKKSVRQLKKMDPKIAKRIFNGVEGIKGNPFLAVDRLSNSTFYKFRVGGYRVILDLRQARMIIFVVETDNRKSIYKK